MLMAGAAMLAGGLFASNARACAGVYEVNANGFYGTLSLHQRGESSRVTGTIFNDRLDGSCRDGEVEFTRYYRDGSGRSQEQHYSGTYVSSVSGHFTDHVNGGGRWSADNVSGCNFRARVVANGFHGTLDVRTDRRGNVSGTIFNDTIRGRCDSRQISFTRYTRDGSGRPLRQEYQGRFEMEEMNGDFYDTQDGRTYFWHIVR